MTNNLKQFIADRKWREPDDRLADISLEIADVIKLNEYYDKLSGSRFINQDEAAKAVINKFLEMRGK